MKNYSDVYAETLAEFESNIVPADQGDAGKGQVNVRAGYKINQQNKDIGFIAKNPGQTQFHGVGVDSLQDKSDGTGADFLTDEKQADGRRLIKLAYSVYPPPAVGSDPTKGWVQPTHAYLDFPGPMKLRGTVEPPVPIPPIPAPGKLPPPPAPPAQWSTAPEGSLEWYSEAGHTLDQMYIDWFGRHADPGGWGNWWWWVITQKKDPAWVASEFVKSAEYKITH